jgi:hypothetical protein
MMKSCGNSSRTVGRGSTFEMDEPRDPIQKLSSIAAVDTDEPTINAVTDPSASFLTQPVKPSCSA